MLLQPSPRHHPFSRCIQSSPSSPSRKHEHIVKLVDVVRPEGRSALPELL